MWVGLIKLIRNINIDRHEHNDQTMLSLNRTNQNDQSDQTKQHDQIEHIKLSYSHHAHTDQNDRQNPTMHNRILNTQWR